MSSKHDSTGRKVVEVSGLLASMLGYDNDASGLGAGDVQAAIDELAATLVGLVDGVSYGGTVDEAGVAVDLPDGWSSSLSTITFTVTHNLGHTDYVVALTPYYDGSANTDDSWTAFLVTKGANSFTYRTGRSEDTTTTTASLTMCDFILKLI